MSRCASLKQFCHCYLWELEVTLRTGIQIACVETQHSCEGLRVQGHVAGADLRSGMAQERGRAGLISFSLPGLRRLV